MHGDTDEIVEEGRWLLRQPNESNSHLELSDCSDSRHELSPTPEPFAISSKRSVWSVLFKGPDTPQQPHVTLVFPGLQKLPDYIKNACSPTWYWAYVSGFLFLWAAVFVVLANNSLLALPTIGDTSAIPLKCDLSYPIWLGKNSKCGIDGQRCGGTIYEGQEFNFRCLADCRKESWSYSETPVGDVYSIYKPFVVGGNNTYRADSYVCGAAVHSGVISDNTGGCGRIRLTGRKTDFASVPSVDGTFNSMQFDSEFPASFEFVSIDGMASHGCKDLRFTIVTVNIIFSLIFAYLYPVATSKAGVGIYTSVLGLVGFWTVILAANPYSPGGSEVNNGELISLAFRRLYPGAMAMYVVYRFSIKPQLQNMHANFSRALIWVPAFWIGVMENYTFGHLPLDRLTKHDLDSQPGAWLALGIIIGSISAIAVGQAYIIWRAGKLAPFLFYYFCIGLGLLFLSMIPSQTLRLHHYIWAMILLPGTGFPTTPGLAYQGLLVGLFVAGIARWDFDSIIQTYNQLRRGAPALVDALPVFLAPSIENNTVLIQWENVKAMAPKYDGYSLIINDVERYRGHAAHFNLSSWISTSLANITGSTTTQLTLPVNYYLRLAFARVLGHETGDYTRAAIFNLEHSNWTFPSPGAV